MELSMEPASDRTLRNGQRRFDKHLNLSLPIAALMIGFVFLILASLIWVRGSNRLQSTLQLSFAPMEQDLGQILVGELRIVSLRAINHDVSRPARLLGVEQHCDTQGCIFWRGSVTTIPPGGEVIFDVEWKGSKLGRIVQDVPIYTDCPNQSIVHLTISGEVVSDTTSTPF